ncbi:MAG: uracil-DNA glycosylase [Acidiferrobacter sp.]
MGITLWERRTAPEAAGSQDPAPDWQMLVDAVRSCTRCPLHGSRTQTVFGIGPRDAQWFFVGEAPGAEEDKRGEPFVGRAGQLLDAMLSALGLAREEVFIANILKCRPPANRDPESDEVASCLPFLQEQLAYVQPRMVVALGRFAAQSLMASTQPLNQLRGRVHDYRGTPLIATYHPAYLLRRPADKGVAWADLKLAREALTV